MSNLKQRLARAELRSGAGHDATIVIVRWGDEDTPLEGMPCTVYQNGKIKVYGLSTLPEHLQDGPVHNIKLTWPD
jgi:hypothetical protein